MAVLGIKNLSVRSDTAWLSTALPEMISWSKAHRDAVGTLPMARLTSAPSFELMKITPALLQTSDSERHIEAFAPDPKLVVFGRVN